jgi:hypothetical protein
VQYLPVHFDAPSTTEVTDATPTYVGVLNGRKRPRPWATTKKRLEQHGWELHAKPLAFPPAMSLDQHQWWFKREAEGPTRLVYSLAG